MSACSGCKGLNESKEISPPYPNGNGGKDNPVLSVVPQGDHFTASSISTRIMKHNIVMKLERAEFLLILLSVKDKSSQCILVRRTSMLHHHKS